MQYLLNRPILGTEVSLPVKRLLLFFSLGLIVSAALYNVIYSFFNISTFWLFLAVVTIIIVLIALICLAKMKFHTGIFVMSFILGSSMGLFSAYQKTAGLLPVSYIGIDVEIKGCIQGFPQLRERHTSFYLGHLDVAGKKWKGKVRLNWYGSFVKVVPGQCWHLTARLKRPHSASSPVTPDFELFMLRQNLVATGYVRNIPEPLLISEKQNGLDYLRWHISHWLKDTLANQWGSVAGIFSALLVGDKQSITKEQWDLFNSTGVTHLLVISGLHIGLIAWLGYLLSKLLALIGCWPLHRWPLQRFSAVIGLLMAYSYALLAGFSVPVQRALIMLGVGLTGVLINRKTSPVMLWLIAFAVVLALDPLAAFNRGFWLSFIAVAALIYGLLAKTEIEARLKYCRTKRSFIQFLSMVQLRLLKALRAQWVVSCALWPCLALAQQPVSFFSFLINLFSIPLIAVVLVPMAMLALATSLFSETLALVLLNGCAYLLEKWVFVLNFFYSHPSSTVMLPGPTMVAVLFAMVGIACLLSPRGLGVRGLSLPCFCPWFFGVTSSLPDGQFKLALLDTGVGVATVIHTRQHSMLLLSGKEFAQGSSYALKKVVVPYLNLNRIKMPDRVIISGKKYEKLAVLSAIDETMTMKLLAVKPSMKNDAFLKVGSESIGINAHVDIWHWNGVKFSFLQLPQVVKKGVYSTYLGNNLSKEAFVFSDMSGVVMVEGVSRSVLVMPELSGNSEKYVASYLKRVSPVDMLIASGKNALSNRLIDAIKPRHLLLAADYRYRFRFPSEAVVTRVKTISDQTKIFVTWREGTIQCDSRLNALCTGYRRNRLIYWSKWLTNEG